MWTKFELGVRNIFNNSTNTCIFSDDDNWQAEQIIELSMICQAHYELKMLVYLKMPYIYEYLFSYIIQAMFLLSVWD